MPPILPHSGNLDRAVHEAFDLSGRHRAGGAGGFSAAFEDGHRGNRADPEALAEFRQRVRVDLDDHETARIRGRHLREFRRNHPAGSTPGRPEVDDDGEPGTPDQLVEDRRTWDLDWLGRWGTPRRSAARIT